MNAETDRPGDGWLDTVVTLAHGELMYVRHTRLDRARPTIVMIHGLGDSSRCFEDAARLLTRSGHNLVAADQLGCGRSSAAADGDYSLFRQVERLAAATRALGVGRVTLVGHSLGGVLGSLWCNGEHDARIERLVNVAGNLVPTDGLLSKVAAAAAQGPDFAPWFHREFVGHIVPDRLRLNPVVLQRYLASLTACRPEAFRVNAVDLVAHSVAIEGTLGSSMGVWFAAVPVPKLYVAGQSNLSPGAAAFLVDAGLTHAVIPDAGHWPMIDRPEAFYAVLSTWIAGGQDI